MADNGIAKVQHYVPQFLLRNFCSGKKDQLHVFDKATGRTFVTNAKNVASESRFYDFEVNESKLTIEPSLSGVESAAKPLLDRIANDTSVAGLTAIDRAKLCSFLAVQFTRTKNYREQYKSLGGMLLERIRDMSPSEDAFIEFAKGTPDLNENYLKLVTAQSVISAPQKFGPYFNDKTWHVLTTTTKHPFLLGDNPITLQNAIDMRPYGNLGLAVKGIEIYFPITPTRALAMWCPSISEELIRGGEWLNQLRSRDPEMLKDMEGALRLVDAVTKGTPLAYKPENIENFNSLQVANSERYVFSNCENFDLVRQMLSTDPHLSSGPRMKV